MTAFTTQVYWCILSHDCKETFLRAFRRTDSAAGLLLAGITYWRDAQIIKGTLPERYRETEGFLKLHLDSGVVPYYI
ncbi:MAG: hypothetical protein ACLFST_08190 [Spirochaetia bacterium]